MRKAVVFLLLLVVVVMLLISMIPDLRERLREALRDLLEWMRSLGSDLLARLANVLEFLFAGSGGGFGPGTGRGGVGLEGGGGGNKTEPAGPGGNVGARNFCTGHGGYSWILVGPRGATRADQLRWVPYTLWDRALYPAAYDGICDDGLQQSTGKRAAAHPDPCTRLGRGQATESLGGNPVRYRCSDGSTVAAG